MKYEKKFLYGLGGVESLYYLIMMLLCLPHFVFLLFSKNRSVIMNDISRWIVLVMKESQGLFFDMVFLLSFYKEFRNVFYLRIGRMRSIPLRYLKQLSSLHIIMKSDDFGEGTFIQHGFSTIITADKIGKNCWINQQVTIGYNDSKKYGYGRPIIEDNVRISCGAKVLGKITVGSNSIIGVNAVVVKDVPPNSVIIPSAMRIKNIKSDIGFKDF